MEIPLALIGIGVDDKENRLYRNREDRLRLGMGRWSKVVSIKPDKLVDR